MTNLAYKDLKDIHEVEEFNKKTDWAFFEDVSILLNKYNKLNKFVITLLHTHFSISKNEYIVESFNEKYNAIDINI